MTAAKCLIAIPLPMFDSSSSRNLFDPDEAAALCGLPAFGINPDRCEIDRPREARGFSGALIFRVRDGERIWCLRRWPSGGTTRGRLAALHHFLRHLQASGIGVLAIPAASTAGETIIEHQALLWQLEPWLPGQADFDEHPSDQRLRSTMRTLAQVHRAAERYECPPAGWPWFVRHPAAPSPACRERLQIIREWSTARCGQARADLEAKTAPEFRRLALEILGGFQIACGPIERELRILHELPVPVHPCLRDIWHDHLLFTGEELTGVVDPSAARAENVASDLSRLLGSLLEDDRPRWETALAAYHHVRTLSPEERRLVTALDRSSVLLSGLTWIDRYLQAPAAESLPRVLPRLEMISRRLARLVEDVSPCQRHGRNGP